MRKKKVTTLRPPNLVNTREIKISKYQGEEYFFEIGNNITQDIIEGVVFMMRENVELTNISWNTEIKDTIHKYGIFIHLVSIFYKIPLTYRFNKRNPVEFFP